MSYLLEILGRGLVSSLRGALRCKLPDVGDMQIKELRARSERHLDDDEVRLLLGLKHLELGDFLKARLAFSVILDHDEDHCEALLGMAAAHDEMGQTAEALACLQRARLIDILDPVILFCIGFCSEKLGDDDEAMHGYGAALRVLPSLRNAHERLAAMFLRRGDHEQALQHYETLVQLDPDYMTDRLSLANLYLLVGRPHDAVEQYEIAISLDPDNWELQDDAVAAYEDAGLIDEAIGHVEEQARRQPDFADHHVRLGDLHARRGDDHAALLAYERALDIEPEYLEAMVKLGTAHLRLGDYIDAARWFNQAVELNDRLLSACVGLGVAQLHAGCREAGLASLELASKIEPNSTLLFSETARIQLKASAAEHVDDYLGEVTQACDLAGDGDLTGELLDRQIERHRHALRETPGHADLHYRLGLLLRNRRRPQEAIASLREAVRINPVYAKALVKLGLALQEAGEVDEAVTVFERALALQPEQAQLHYQLGLLFAEKHLFELALEHFDRAQRGLSGDAELQAHLSLALQNAGLLDRAECSWRTTCELDGGAEDLPDVTLN